MLERKRCQSFRFHPTIRLTLVGPVEAWHVSMNTDPLMDSDDETYADENTRLDYGSSCLVRVLTILRPLILPFQCCVSALSVGCVARNPHPRGNWVPTKAPTA